jgi:OOP family OmpA-OmpF porin
MLLPLTGCMTARNAVPLATAPAVPAANEQLALDQIIVLVDVTGSMSGGKYWHEKALVDAFTGAMPDGPYEAGIDSFSGVSVEQWVQLPLGPYNRPEFEAAESRISLLGSLTPLSRSIRMVAPEMKGKGGCGALLVFSDGLVRSDRAVLNACEAIKAAHNGELCIYTVQIGNRDRGRKLLQDMATGAQCGAYWNATDLNSVAAIDQMVRTIFFGERAEVAAPPANPVREKREMVLSGEVLFDFDKSILKPEGKVEVDRVIGLLKEFPNDDIEIAGHTCDRGADEYNMALSQRRADAVRDYAIAQGIQPERITTKAYGETMPAVPNTDEANRKLNRRITFVQ